MYAKTMLHYIVTFAANKARFRHLATIYVKTMSRIEFPLCLAVFSVHAIPTRLLFIVLPVLRTLRGFSTLQFPLHIVHCISKVYEHLVDKTRTVL